MRSIKQPIRSCVQTRKFLRKKCATLRALIKQPQSDPENAIASTVETLRKSYREALILHIMTGEQIARNVVVLFETNLPGTLKLWKVWDLLGRTCNDVGELLEAVAKPESRAESAPTK